MKKSSVKELYSTFSEDITLDKVYIIKWALTKGIIVCENVTQYANRCTIHDKKHGFFHAGEWFSSLGVAVSYAKKMRDRKLISLNKQIDKLKNLRFE